MEMFSLRGRCAMITGAGRGIGRAIAGAMARAGAHVILSGRTSAPLNDAAEILNQSGYTASALVMDVASPAAIEAGFVRLSGLTDRLDILVNNAGIEEICPSVDVDEARWDRILGTNLKGAFFCARQAARIMGQGGSILNICSLTSEVGIPTAVPYGAAKTGLAGVTRALAAEWAPRGIRVNGIGPGYFRTAMTEGFYADEDWCQTMLGKIPMRRFGELAELEGAAVFLCSPAASYITGQILYIDGGFLASI
ncbi:MAG: SDR family oxidoreductase [Acidocella sp.]|nr:SDR family oxidoreductase [Acidocella sp.]